MDPSSIVQYISETFAGVEVVGAEEGIPAGDTFFMYDPERILEPKQKMPFATIVTKDYGDFDRASNLNRAVVFRLNIGVSRDTLCSIPAPKRSPRCGHCWLRPTTWPPGGSGHRAYLECRSDAIRMGRQTRSPSRPSLPTSSSPRRLWSLHP